MRKAHARCLVQKDPKNQRTKGRNAKGPHKMPDAKNPKNQRTKGRNTKGSREMPDGGQGV
jgi:hypothetical protein